MSDEKKCREVKFEVKDEMRSYDKRCEKMILMMMI